MNSEEYDSLTAEERDLRDKADREREAAEQAGNFHSFIYIPALPYPRSTTLSMDPRAR